MLGFMDNFRLVHWSNLNHEADLRVANLINFNNGSWNRKIVREVFNEEIVS